jgi:hypothetical protein
LKIETIKDACPLCGGHVKGNERYKYLCKKCNVLFVKAELAHTPVAVVAKKVEPKPTGLKYVVSSKSNSYHLPGCRYIRQINRENLSFFDAKQQAEKKGYHPCICVRRKNGA